MFSHWKINKYQFLPDATVNSYMNLWVLVVIVLLLAKRKLHYLPFLLKKNQSRTKKPSRQKTAKSLCTTDNSEYLLDICYSPSENKSKIIIVIIMKPGKINNMNAASQSENCCLAPKRCSLAGDIK